MKMIVCLGLVLGALSAAGDVIIAKVGGSAQLACGDGSYSNSMTWYRGTDLIKEETRRGVPRRGNGDIPGRSVFRYKRLEISRLTEADGGKFRCNVDGRDRVEHTLFLISVSVTPSGDLLVGSKATLQCKVSQLDEGLTVEWTGPKGQSHKQSEVVLNTVAASDGGSWRCKITYHGKEIHTENLSITVKEPVPVTTKSPTRSNSNVPKPDCKGCDPLPSDGVFLGLKWWIWVAIGVGSIVVILLIVCVIVKCIRIRRKKREYVKMKQAQQAMRTRKYCQCDRPTAAAKPPQQGRRREKPSALPL